MGRSVQYALFVFFWLVAIVFHALLALAYICLIMVAAMDGGDLAVVAALLLGGIGVVVLRVLYGLVAIPAAGLVAPLLQETAATGVAPRWFLPSPGAQSEGLAVGEAATSVDGKSSEQPGDFWSRIGVAGQWSIGIGVALPLLGWLASGDRTVTGIVALLIVIPLWTAVLRLVFWLFGK